MLRATCLAFVLTLGAASAARLVPLPDPASTLLPVGGFEANRGQVKPEVLFLHRGSPSLAVTAQAVLLSPLAARIEFLSSNSDPAVRFSDPLPGVANSLTGADPRRWVTGVPRHTAATLEEVYPGIDVRFTSCGRQVSLTLVLRPGADLETAVLQVTGAATLSVNMVGEMVARFGPSRLDPILLIPVPVARQAAASGPVSRTARYEVESGTQFRLLVEGRDETLPLEIELTIGSFALAPDVSPAHAVDAAGNTYLAAAIPDAAGVDAPFPSSRWTGCGTSIATPFACSDVAVYKFSRDGELVFVTYLAGRTRDAPSFLGTAPDGSLVVVGVTDSYDFPSTADAFQSTYAGPAPVLGVSGANEFRGDFFVARLDPETGALRSATFLGGPEADRIGGTAIGPDGSVYFFPKLSVPTTARMPSTAGALQRECAGDPCGNGYAARLSPMLDRLLYGTYLPGRPRTAMLHSDGSVYYAGNGDAGFPATQDAYQRQSAGGADGIVARLDATGGRLLFGTFLGTAVSDVILRMAVAPDGSVWVGLSSFVECCVDIAYRLVRLDAEGSRILADRPIPTGDLRVDHDGNLHATAWGSFSVPPEGFQAHACAWSYAAYLKLAPSGDQLFASYLPSAALEAFEGVDERGRPIVGAGGERFVVDESQPPGVYTGCVVDGAGFGNPDAFSPGQIVTLFGGGMGPREGVAFELDNGRVPLSLAGTRVLVNDEPAAILYSSHWQVNAILPYSLEPGTRPRFQVEFNANAGNEIAGFLRVQRQGLSLFRVWSEPGRWPRAAALNEDGTVNSPENPARAGTSVVLFGTGGGATAPPSSMGEVTPLELRPLEVTPRVVLADRLEQLTVEWAGAAPGLVAGVTQINVKLPGAIPEFPEFPRGVVPIAVESPGVSYSGGIVTVAVAVD